ncbi:DUF1266 domain-containing protein [Cellulophaga omnivescoria]|uniref:DUF1266 domain-containing protein n=1 Tax=Cellulophaga omnivescoria TaxID=1888890 RepID=UPI0009868B35|nr:DUF1266 domain-containing protein [Cellulophaga omnivescoria]WBU89573.1 DUF1266 domain-containing protein [Cellulophaga omnivescoria]
MKKTKQFKLFALCSAIILSVISCGTKAELKDDTLSSFMLGGIYFIHGYGGANSVESMMSNAGYTTNEELVSGYKEIFEFPFETSDSSGAKRVLKNSWDITNKESLLEALKDLETRDYAYKSWDYARIANNVSMGYAAGYLTKEECLSILANTLTLAKEKYKDWDTYYQDFDKGRNDWNSEDPEKDSFETLAKVITKGDKSIFNILPLHN